MSKKAFFAGALLIAVVIGYVVYVNFLKTAPSMSKLKAEYKLNAIELYTEFDSNEELANQKYQNKVIEITGELESITNEEGANASISLKTEGFGVIKCTLESPLTPEQISSFEEKPTLTIRGECIGVLLDVLVERSIIL